MRERDGKPDSASSDGRHPVIIFPPFHLDRTEQRLWRGERLIPLKPKTFAIEKTEGFARESGFMPRLPPPLDLAIGSMEEILDVPGVGAAFVGPGDLSACQGHLGQWEGPGVAEQVLAIRAAAERRGLATGLLATDLADAVARRDQGFRMLGLGSETLLLIGAIERMREALR